MKASKIIPIMILLFSILAISFSPAAAKSSLTAVTCTQYYTVQKGDYLAKIARALDLPWKWLADINNISDPNHIEVGQKLCVKTADAPACSETYTVVKGDYLSKIARNYNVSWRYLADINNLSNPNLLFAGQKLCVKMSGDTGTVPPANPIPIISIADVVKDQSVTIKTSNFPAHVSFDVRMGKFGTAGINGIKVTSIDSGQGGTFTQTFNIPAELKGQSKIAIRLESPNTGYFSYNWFVNQ